MEDSADIRANATYGTLKAHNASDHYFTMMQNELVANHPALTAHASIYTISHIVARLDAFHKAMTCFTDDQMGSIMIE